MELLTDDYAPDQDLPVGGYAVLLSVHGALLSLFLVFLRRTGRELPAEVPTRDLILMGAGTWRATRVATKNVITAPLRAPFTQVEEMEGKSNTKETARGHGLRRAIGELLTCPYCLAAWVSAAFMALFVVSPRTARFLASILTVQVISNEMNEHLA